MADLDKEDNFALNLISEPLSTKVRKKPSPKKTKPGSSQIYIKPRIYKPKTDSNFNYKSVITEYDSGFSDSNIITDQKEKSSQIKKNISSGNFKEKSELYGNKYLELDKESNIKSSNSENSTATLNPKNPIQGGKKIYISSLFKNNPEIPHIEPSKLHGKKESLFSNQTFDNLNLHPHLVSCLEARFNATQVTEVQGRSIPVLLSGNDALIKSCTGSGKTLSYAIPIVQKLQEIRPKIMRSDGVFALVILPTRELVLQSYECFSNLTKAFNWIVPGYLIGGEKKKSEKARIRKGINILISTPGRLLDHLEHTSKLNLKDIQWLIIDEADQLLELKFEHAILNIMSFCSSEKGLRKQIVLLSATLTKEVEKLAGMSLHDPTHIDVANKDGTMEDLVIPSQLKQYVVIAPTKLRLVTLSAFIVDKCFKGDFKALVFMLTQNIVDFYFLLLSQILKPILKHKGHKIKFFKLHGNLKQEDRTEIFHKFKAVRNGILFCTDVVARGIHLPHVDWILQYSIPTGAENYVHRVGRTARIGQKGCSLLFIQPSEVGFTEVLQKHRMNIEELDSKDIIRNLLLIADMIHESSRQTDCNKPIEEHASKLQLKYEDLVYSEVTLYESAKNAFLSYVHAYSAYPKVMRSAVPFHKLHLGHAAKSFCLRESPSELGCKLSKPPPQFAKLMSNKFESNRFKKYPEKRKHSLVISEFDSGFSLLGKGSSFKKRKKK